MERRKFIIGVGALGAGTSAALSTGAFTNVEATRSMTVSTAGDGSAYLRLMPADSQNGSNYASYTEDGTLSVTLDQLNENAVTTVERLFTLQNEGSQTVSVYLDDASDAVSFEVGGDSVEGPSGAVRLSTGESATVDVTVDTTGDAGGELLSDVTVMAKSQVFAPSDDNVVTVGPSGSGADELTVQAGVDAAASTGADAVLVYTGEYEESVTVAQDGLTLGAAENASPVVAAPDGEPSAVTVDANGVTVQGLVVENELGATASHQGISLATGASDLQILTNTIRNVGTAADASGNSEAIAGVGGHSSVEIVGNTIRNVHSSYDTDRDWYTSKGIYLTSNPTGTAGESDPVSDVRIRNNTVTGVSSDVAAYGVQLQDDVSGVEIADNTISGISGDADDEYTAEVSNWGGNYDWASAINLGQGTPTGPSDVYVHDNYLSADSHPNGDNTPGYGVVLEGDTDAGSVRVRQNDIEAAGGLINKTGSVVDANGNWWNAASGPAGFDADAATATAVASAGSATADGSGAYVVDYDGDGTAEVNFDDYRSQPVFSETHTVDADGSLEDAIAAAQPGDTVEILGEHTLDNVEVATPDLTITAGDDSATITVPKTAESNTQDRAFDLTAEGVTVSDLSFVAASDITNPNEINVAASGVTVSGNEFTRNVDVGADVTAYSTIHVDHQGVSGVEIADNTVEKGAIGMGGSGTTTVTGNTIVDSGVEGIYAVVNGDEEYVIENNSVNSFDGLGGGTQALKLTEVPQSVNGTTTNSAESAATAVLAGNPDVESVLVKDADGQNSTQTQ